MGSGFSVSVSATSIDGGTSCQGSASFGVAARATTKVVVHLRCREPGKTGSVGLEGGLNTCPVVDGISASSAETSLAAPIALVADARDADQAPAALSYQWSVSSGALANCTTRTPTFTCTTAGDATITLSVTDSDCSDSLQALPAGFENLSCAAFDSAI